jgi:hypothetical protein
MQLVDRIEKRRFVGREFLLWLWFESEIFDATLRTKEHGEFGLWIERQLVVSASKQEVTRIKGSFPAGSREAKEALGLGKMPETAGLHLSWREHETSFVLKAEQMSLSGLALKTALGHEEDAPRIPIDPLLGKRGGKPRNAGRARAKKDAEAESDEAHEAFYERMLLTREVEGLLEAVFRDFLSLRLSVTWDDVVVPALRAWAAGDAARAKVDADAYRAARDAALSPKEARRASASTSARKAADRKSQKAV